MERERERNIPLGGREVSLLPASKRVVAPAGIRRSVRRVHECNWNSKRTFTFLEKVMLTWTFGEQLLF